MKVTLSPRAEKQLHKLSKVYQIIIAQKIRSLKENILFTSEEKLKGNQKIYRIRVGDIRIVYKKSQKEIYIILIGHRKDIYKLINRLLR